MNRKIKQQLRLQKVEDLTWDAELPSLQLGLNLMKQTSGYSAYQKLHGWVLYRPAFLPMEFCSDKHTDYLQSEDEWAKENVRRMTKLIVDQFQSEEMQKTSSLMNDSCEVIQLPIGTTVLVYFPVTKPTITLKRDSIVSDV